MKLGTRSHLLERAAADRVKRALTGNSELADRNDVLTHTRETLRVPQ
jgi:hypothetical protein